MSVDGAAVEAQPKVESVRTDLVLNRALDARAEIAPCVGAE